MATPSHISVILARIGRDERLSESERQLLQEWMDSVEFETELIDYHHFLEQTSELDYALALFDKALQTSETPAISPPTHRVHFLRTAWVRYAAAVIIILLGAGVYLWTTRTHENNDLVQHTEPVPAKNDVMPGSNRAVLTLSDGKKIHLDSSETEIRDGEISIDNINGGLRYVEGERVAKNTMTTPKGGQYQLTLADGTKVWLNAASSITYPTAFTGKTREVSISGEAYFEVAKKAAQPFTVHTPTDDIAVLGTSFNVNAYADEPTMKTSLVEGSVKVGKVILQPGQAHLNGKIIPTDLEQDVAWKNGAFNFRNMDTEAAFRQLARWYNIEIRFAGRVPSQLGGEIGRDLNLSQVLIALEDIGIHTRIEGNTLIVLSEQ